ncbi:MAG: hypothetical protein A3I17_01680 [Candidatus Rokubacteria bacterium RIFCSPLOWO2_02_FULL_72_37]|nr:MAG: hypothetical protein A3I17_01680 [Candidatus Rokubacteria bacterium RIFCSPLOWO2_02_FULL_72_37]
MRTLRSLSFCGAVLAALTLLASAAEAQMRQASAEVVRATGRVEALRQGQAQWAAAGPGTRLAEGDQIRAMAGASADLALPDGSTILVAENTRFAVTKLEYDAQTRERTAMFHLVVGKVRAQVARAAVQLVRARDSNFAISTPVGVAAVRGTIPVVFYNPDTQQAVVFSFPSPGEDPASARVTFFNFATNTSQTFTGHSFVTVQGNQPTSSPTPVSSLSPAAQQQIQTAVNQATAGSGQLTAAGVLIVSAAQIEAILAQLFGLPAVVVGPPSPILTPPATGSVGRDLVHPATILERQPSCASPPCP